MNTGAARPLDRPSAAVPGPPHVHTPLHVARAMTWVLVAASPCVAVAVYNTGLQANLALTRGDGGTIGWRAPVLGLLGAGQRPDGVWDCVALGLLHLVPLLLAALLGGAAVERGFARLRGRRPDHVALPVIALLFTLALPPSLPLWQAAIGCAAGVLLGKEIFGGFGRNFVNPCVMGLAFLLFAWPGAVTGDTVWIALEGAGATTPLSAAASGGLGGIAAAGFAWRDAWLGLVPGALGETSALACTVGVVLLLALGLASWRIVAGGLLGLLVGLLVVRALAPDAPMASVPWHWHVVLGSFAFGLGFLATDPVTAAVTDPGRWLYGLLIGLLVVLIRAVHPAHREGVVLAILLGNVAAPLLDQLVARVQLRRRWFAHGG